ncbi:MAG: 2-C-methyl-D-erythritol 4-phosphate cytidylyltransferase [Ruminococcus sp.]|nr:2-C-methyl-D-erythritol 4-phosphate cytidylyltransferase [Ruminococcus sp.]MCD7800842.1 2-C-methyl-D-erythritol 4-phosphate cytidylyltransferase [Ruminococcus sp.]
MSKNIFGVILAGGNGSRMGNVEKPKQFMELGDKPILIHTIEKFILNNSFECIIVLVPHQWIKHTQDIISKYITIKTDSIFVIEGGSSRNETIMQSIKFIEEKYSLDDDTIIVTHDSVRPFVTHRIIEENISYTKLNDACDTVIPATDTIVESCDGEIISSIPNRSSMYQGQTPQSFKAKKLRKLYLSLTEQEKSILTDACKIMVLKGERVHLVSGEVYNIKITYPYDLTMARAILEEFH